MTSGRALRVGEAILAVFVLALGLFIAVETALMRTGPAYSAVSPKLFPSLVAGGLLLVGAALLYEARTGAVAHPTAFQLDLPPTVAITIGLVLQMILMKPAGFVIATTLMFVAVCHSFGSRRPALNAAVGFVLCLFTHVAFSRGLGLILPSGVLSPLLG